jgi:hypothetical protein
VKKSISAHFGDFRHELSQGLSAVGLVENHQKPDFFTRSSAEHDNREAEHDDGEVICHPPTVIIREGG